MKIRITWLPKSVRRAAYEEVADQMDRITESDVALFRVRVLALLRGWLKL